MRLNLLNFIFKIFECAIKWINNGIQCNAHFNGKNIELQLQFTVYLEPFTYPFISKHSPYRTYSQWKDEENNSRQTTTFFFLLSSVASGNLMHTCPFVHASEINRSSNVFFQPKICMKECQRDTILRWDEVMSLPHANVNSQNYCVESNCFSHAFKYSSSDEDTSSICQRFIRTGKQGVGKCGGFDTGIEFQRTSDGQNETLG